MQARVYAGGGGGGGGDGGGGGGAPAPFSYMMEKGRFYHMTCV